MADESAVIAGVNGQLLIGGEWRDASGGGTFGVEDPSTGETLCEIADGTPDDAKAALDAACDAQAGWAASAANDRAELLHDVFALLDELEGRLGDGRDFLLGDRFTEADVRLFVTLVRFDAAYHDLFKCNLRRISDYPALSAYQARILAIPGVRDTVSIDHIKRGYYSVKALNPTGIVPMGPALPAALAG